ncbi:ankyrin repeat and SOCS box protein 13 [Hyalella azteca]|uniref:Ankyrin repeat and SOCS box protein 13 n=1 Tax=Hyalella azteca TaxID=294128 RepID=A0A8B7N365_HYAAZ|nr:ankyrin repeat and SOCS box protein 13 [Hyalella azteca]
MFPLHDVVIFGNVELVREALETYKEVDQSHYDGVTPLHMACLAGRLDIVKLLIDHGANVEATCQEGSTPLCGAAAGCHPEIAALLLKYGARVNPPLLLSTPLHEACIRSSANPENCLQVVRLLLDHGADISCSDSHYGTPLHAACSKREPNLRVIELLLQSGSNPNCLQYHRTPLHLIAENSQSYDCALTLISYGADINLTNWRDKRAIDLVPKGTLLHDLLLTCGHQPLPLQHMARLAARKALGRDRLKHVNDLLIPAGLKRFLR